MPYACPHCGRYFEREAGRDYHLTQRHGAAPPIYSTITCPCDRLVAYLPRDIYKATNGRSFVVCAGNHTVWLPTEKESHLVDRGDAPSPGGTSPQGGALLQGQEALPPQAEQPPDSPSA